VGASEGPATAISARDHRIEIGNWNFMSGS
jgi:hypothetical protein